MTSESVQIRKFDHDSRWDGKDLPSPCLKCNTPEQRLACIVMTAFTRDLHAVYEVTSPNCISLMKLGFSTSDECKEDDKKATFLESKLDERLPALAQEIIQTILQRSKFVTGDTLLFGGVKFTPTWKANALKIDSSCLFEIVDCFGECQRCQTGEPASLSS